VTDWVRVCEVDEIDQEDVIPFALGERQFAIYRSPSDTFHATDGLCTHEKVQLADGLVMGQLIECPKHNGRFDYTTGEAQRMPACINLATYPVKVDEGVVYLQPDPPD